MKKQMFCILIMLLPAFGGYGQATFVSSQVEGLAGCSTPAEKKPAQPNIILILADDMGYSDIGCFGSEIQTPNIDKLAAEGLMMTGMYNAARCCPSRASLLTGLYPHQTGVGDMLQNDNLPAYQTRLNNRCVTLAEVLSTAGYQCFISGKWHLGNEPEGWPMKRGFHRQYPSNGTTGHYFGIARGRDLVIEDTLREPPGEWIKAGEIEYKLFKNEDGSQWYFTDAITSRAINYIKELRQTEPRKPFFLYLPFTAPHWPLHAFEEDIQKYQGKYLGGWDSLREVRYRRMIELGIISPEWTLSERNENAKDWNALDDSTKKFYDRMMAVYAAMIDRMDQNIGRLLTELQESGEMENTLILFLSDNGGCHETPHRGKPGALPGTPDSYDGYEFSWANASNTPFSWFKHWTHEGGSSTPLIVWYPKLIQGGRKEAKASHIIDIMPTLAELAGADYPQNFKGNVILPMEGKSLVPLFLDPSAKFEHNALFWEHEGNRAIWKGNFKLVSRFDYQKRTELPWELYNLKADRSETENLTQENPALAAELEQLYNAWAKRVHVVPYAELVEIRSQKRNENQKK